MPTILLIEDDVATQTAISHALTEGGYRVINARNGREGIETLAASDDEIDLVLFDLSMPVMDGWAFLAEMKTRHLTHIPAHAITASHHSDCLGVPCLQKPFGTGTLIRIVEANIRTSPGR